MEDEEGFSRNFHENLSQEIYEPWKTISESFLEGNFTSGYSYTILMYILYTAATHHKNLLSMIDFRQSKSYPR